jgi:hypothetical protein
MSMRTALRLILQEHGPGTKAAKVRGWSFERRAVWTMLKRLDEEWAADFKEFAGNERPRQAERLRQDLARMRALTRPSFQAIARHEELLARIAGTMQPIRVEVDVMHVVQVSIATVIAELTEAERDRIVAEQLELEALAAGRPLLNSAAQAAE